MDISEQIQYCQNQLSQLGELRQGCLRDGIPKNHEVYNLLAKQEWYWIFTWEILGFELDRFTMRYSDFCHN